jgi:hypothetical protein
MANCIVATLAAAGTGDDLARAVPGCGMFGAGEYVASAVNVSTLCAARRFLFFFFRLTHSRFVCFKSMRLCVCVCV